MSTPSNSSGLLNLVRVLVFGGAALCLGVAVAETWGHRAAETLPAQLEVRRTAIVAGYDCQLAEVLARSGQRVEPGTPLLRFTDEKLDARLQAKRRELSAAIAEGERAAAAAEVELTWRRRELQREIYQTEQESTRLEQERLSRQVEQIAWNEHLQQVDHWLERATEEVSLRPVALPSAKPDTARLQALLKEDAAAAAAESLQKQLTRIDARLKELNGLDAALENKVRVAAGVEVAHQRQTQIEAELAALEAQQASLTIQSTTCGLVGVWARQPGDHLAAGELVVELLDDAQVSLAAALPSRSLGKIQSGQTVELLFPGDLRLKGVVGDLPPQVTTTSTSAEDSSLSVRISPTGKLWPKLPVGTRVSVVVP